MSVQKLVAEADRLFEKGRAVEGVAKLKSALGTEPLNQIVATKLANVLIELQNFDEAAKVYGSLAKRLSEAGRSQVAIAIFKQAIELSPQDVSLRLRYAQECEAVGKLGDAFLQGQIVLQHYLRRKRYFDASNILLLMARSQPKDEKVKAAWIESLLFCQADQKMIHLMVALSGPPGLVSQEFTQGGDPAALSPAIYESLKRLLVYFPRDPRLAYSLAWAAYRRGQMADFFRFLRECFRREPDYCLGMLLFSRVLAEAKKLNESLFVYRYFKERMPVDRSSDMLTLNRLMESFVEKNGWIRFMEDGGDLLDTPGFFEALTGQSRRPAAAVAAETVAQATERKENIRRAADLPPAEIDIGAAAPSSDLEVLDSIGQSIVESKGKRPLGKKTSTPMQLQAELIKATVEAAVAGMGSSQSAQSNQVTQVQPVVLPVIQAIPVAGNASTLVPPSVLAEATAAAIRALAEGKASLTPVPPIAASAFVEKEAPTGNTRDTSGSLAGFAGGSVEFTSLIQRPEEALAELGLESELEVAPPYEPSGAQDLTGEIPRPPPSPTVPVAPRTFNPFGPNKEVPTDAEVEEAALLHGDETKIFSPFDVLDAAKVMQNHALDGVETKRLSPSGAPVPPPLEPLVESLAEKEERDKTLWRILLAEGEKTIDFNPSDAIAAAAASRRPVDTNLKAAARPVVPPPLPLSVEAANPPLDESRDDDKTTILPSLPPLPSPAAEAAAEDSPSHLSLAPEDATMVATQILTGNTAMGTMVATQAMTSALPTKQLILGASEGMTMTPSPLSESHGEVALPQSADREEPMSMIFPTSMPLGSAGFVALPEAAAVESPAIVPAPAAPVAPEVTPESELKIDLGDDLLDGPTRIFAKPENLEKTEVMLKELKQELREKPNGAALNVGMLLRKAERYTAKRNYYLARKALRHAQALGADDTLVKNKLREIRKLELPDGLYHTMSSDQAEPRIDTSDVLERLEEEFSLGQPGVADELSEMVTATIETILSENDPRTILDFGVGLHEMGLFRQAEALFIRLVEEFPEHSFDAYYLAAIAKLGRRDYAGAASILRRLSIDNGKTDQEKIQIYYALGETFEKMRQHDRSRHFFEKVAELDANYRNVRHKLEE